MNIETARALVEDIDAGAYELSEALEWALDELEGGEAVSACLPPTSRSAEVMQAYNEGAVISIGDILRLAAEVDELRAEKAARDTAITKILELIKNTTALEYDMNGGVIRGRKTYARACEIAGRAE